MNVFDLSQCLFSVKEMASPNNDSKILKPSNNNRNGGNGFSVVVSLITRHLQLCIYMYDILCCIVYMCFVVGEIHVYSCVYVSSSA